MPRTLLAVAVLTCAVASRADKPVDGNTARPGFTPPVLIGVQNDGKGPKLRPIPFPAADEVWLRAQTAHFVIHSSANEARTRQMAAGLETLAAALTRFAPLIASTAASTGGTPGGTPTRVLVFTRGREVQPYFDYLLNRDAAHVTGVFVLQKNAGSMIIEAGGVLQGDRTTFHELVHSLLERSDKRAPLWLEEGLAEYFSTAELRSSAKLSATELHSGTLFAGAPIQEHVDTIRRGPTLPLAQLFGVVRDSDTYNLPAGQRMFYAESWAAVDTLMHRDRDHFYEFFADVKNGTPVETALQTHFGMTVAALDRAVHSYGAAFHGSYGAGMPVPNVDTTVTVTRVERADLLCELGAFLLALNPESPEATRHFKAALELNPRHARSLAALGRYDEAIAADPANSDLYLTYAESLLGTQLGLLAEADQPEEKEYAAFRKARALAEKALALGGDEARARGDYGVSFMIEPDGGLAPGIEALRRAHELAPERNDFAIHLFAFLRRTGDPAEPLLGQLLAARSKQVAYAARAIVVRTELARANALTHKEQLDAAADVIRKLAAGTEDLDARRDLIRQADDLTKTASVNRQITLYNQAIGEVNAGKYAAARKTLTSLLAQTTDPGIIRDAQKLQKELAGKRDWAH